jgi:DNA-binding response OmpR family regulator
MRVLFLHDEPVPPPHLGDLLHGAGHEVHFVAKDREFNGAPRGPSDLLIVECLPPADAATCVRRLRRRYLNSRVLVITGPAGEQRVAALRAGADDCISKPYLREELLARVEALGRRNVLMNGVTVLAVGELRMDLVHHKCMAGGEPLPLSPREFELLQVFMEEPGRIFSREEICERIWERPHEYDTRTVEIIIMRLRKKLHDETATLIETIRGVGYALRPPGKGANPVPKTQVA